MSERSQQPYVAAFQIVKPFQQHYLSAVQPPALLRLLAPAKQTMLLQLSWSFFAGLPIAIGDQASEQVSERAREQMGEQGSECKGEQMQE